VRVGAHSALDSVSDVSPVTPVIGAAGALAGAQAPTISGSAQVGQALTVRPGAWSGGVGASSYAYQWQSCNLFGSDCEDVEGATASSYVPVSGDAGQRLRALLTATDEHGAKVSQSSQLTQPVASTQAPVAEQPPAVSGAALQGQTLTAGTGVLAGAGPISYSYQWERCVAGGSCQAIEGATQSSYTLTESDVGSAVLALVSASEAGGSTTAVSAATAAVGPETLLELSPPTIAGVLQPGGTLSADPGIWSAAGAVTYAYQWELCNAAGEDCTAIEGASEPTYAPVSGELGSTLRVRVTVTSPLGSKSATSAQTTAAPGGEASVEEAQTIAERTDPAVLAPSTVATLEEQSISPALSDTGEELAAQSTLTSSTISKETAGEFAVNTPTGELSLTPVESQATAATPPTIVNGAAALTANSWPATDTIIRPQPLGAAAILQLRSPEAPRSFSWQLRLGPDEELKQLPDGSVAVVEAPATPTEPSRGQEAGETGPLRDTSAGPPETSEEKAEAEQEEAQPETEAEVPLESLPASPQTHASPGEAGSGQPQPQQTQAAYEAAKSTMAAAEAQTAGKALMAIAPPAVTDAEGHTVPASLAIAGDTLTLTVRPGKGAAYPLLADTAIAAPSNKQSTARAHVTYGLSDPIPEKEGHIDEHFNEKGEAVAGFDPNLKNGPLQMSTARLIVPYDVVVSTSPDAAEEKKRLEIWLQKVKKEELKPYITIGKDLSVDPCGEKHNPVCPPVSTGQYKTGVERLMEDLIAGNPKRGFPPVEQWGAWNEPDLKEDPLHKNRARAAQFWEIAQSILARLSKQYHCGHCAVVAGEFAYSPTYEPDYTSVYRNALLCHPRGAHHCAKRYWGGSLPAIWGFHDYRDVIERKGAVVADAFTSFLQHGRVGKPQVFMSEAGVKLQTGMVETELGELKSTTETARAEKRELQQRAAEEFLKLHVGLLSVDRMYYYEYTAPSRAQQNIEHTFDSALLEVENGELRERPAYCVLAYDKHMCPPTVAAESFKIFAGYGGCNKTPSSVELTGHVDPEGGKTFSYHFEYGPTSSYGQSTPAQNVQVANAWTPVEVHAEIPVSVEETSYGQCPAPIHFRLVGENAQAEHSTADKTIGYTINV
jgi:hypothetical protein